MESSSEIEKKLWKYTLFSRWFHNNTLVTGLKYESGIESIDPIKGKISLIKFTMRPNWLEIIFHAGFKTYHVGMESRLIKSWTLLEPSRKWIEVKKSVVGRAVVGWLLLWWIWAVVGGLSGTGTKNIWAWDHILSFDYDGSTINFSCNVKNIQKIYDFLNFDMATKLA